MRTDSWDPGGASDVFDRKDGSTLNAAPDADYYGLRLARSSADSTCSFTASCPRPCAG